VIEASVLAELSGSEPVLAPWPMKSSSTTT
jgi:hypothetical protein